MLNVQKIIAEINKVIRKQLYVFGFIYCLFMYYELWFLVFLVPCFFLCLSLPNSWGAILSRAEIIPTYLIRVMPA